ncbi:MAG: HipA N-terminal domain-containing protein [Treponemataceae bacterium]|nr:HipA N-terminal domain-containing protein [Treponemataceae bacterium]
MTLDVYFGSVKAGELHSTDNRGIVFSYSRDYLADKDAQSLSASLPLRATATATGKTTRSCIRTGRRRLHSALCDRLTTHCAVRHDSSVPGYCKSSADNLPTPASFTIFSFAFVGSHVYGGL